MSLRERKLLAFVLASSAAVWAADPGVGAGNVVVGTWNLNVAKSKYNPEPAPKSETRVYQPYSAGIKVTIRTITADGQSSSVEFTADNDGKEYPITGRGYIDAITLTKLNSHESEATLMHGHIIVGKAVRTISPDGRTMTITYKGTDAEARQVDNIAVYDKQ